MQQHSSTQHPPGSRAGRPRTGQIVVGLLLLLDLIGLGIGAYFNLRPPPPLADGEEYKDDRNVVLPPAAEFEHLAKTNPVAMYEKCLSRYQREVKNGITATLLKQERVKGKPQPPEEPRQEVIKLSVRGDVPDEHGKTKVQVLMVWEAGPQKVLGSEVRATLFNQEKGGNLDKIVTWRPGALLQKEHSIDLNGPSATDASRFCMRDAGVYRGMLRTYEAWKERKDAGTLTTEYLGRQVVEKAGGRECHVIRRICPTPEVDAFELGGKPDLRPETVAKEGFSTVTVMIDAERWLQVGTELRAADGTLIGAYYFRDLDLNPTFPPDTFTVAGLKKK